MPLPAVRKQLYAETYEREKVIERLSLMVWGLVILYLRTIFMFVAVSILAAVKVVVDQLVPSLG